MGGGDLNTKKSWHPSTLKNQERVWKAEQAAASEKKRINDLRREIDLEKSKEELLTIGQSSGVLKDVSDKLDWMYKGPNDTVDREDYLLGKSVDNNFERLAAEERQAKATSLVPKKNHVEHECIPFSIRYFRGDALSSKEIQVDMARKVMEDPLVAIKKRELESRAQLLQNPVKVKELTRLLREEQEAKKRKRDKKKKKKKDLDSELNEKLKLLKSSSLGNFDIDSLLSSKDTIKRKKTKSKKKKHTHQSTEETDSEDERKQRQTETHSENKNIKYRENKHAHKIYRQVDKREKNVEKRNKYSESFLKDNLKHKRPVHLDEEKHKRKDYIMPHSSRQYHTSTSTFSDDQNDESKRIKYSQDKEQKFTTEFNKTTLSKNPKNFKQMNDDNKHWRKPERKQLSVEERNAKLKEMMANASSRDKEREKNIARYHEQDEKQAKKDKVHEFDKSFVEKQLRKTAYLGSVESRIKANINNIQRSRRDMDNHFAKR